MPITQTKLDYSDRDFDSLRLRLQGLIRSVFPDWTDFNVANFGNLLLEMFSHVGDTLHFYQDNQAAEAFWPTLTQRISAIRLGRLIGYTLSGASSATGSATFSLPSIATENVPIAIGTRLKSVDPENPVAFRTTVASQISIGTSSVSVPIEQAEARNETFESTEEPNQEIVLSFTPYLDSSATVSAADGSYTEVSSFLGQTATDKVFVVLVDQLDRAHVRFGNGATGAIPQGTISVSYKTGGGTVGNVEANKIQILETSLSFSPSGNPAPVTVTNTAATSGGTDRTSLAEARAQAPASLRVLTRTVTREDFENVATSVAGVSRALMATSNEDASVSENFGVLYVVAQGATLDSGRIAAATPSTATLQAVTDEINNNKPSTITFQFETRAVVFKTVNISTRVYLEQGASTVTVGAAIRSALDDFFAAQLEAGVPNTDIDFGANLRDVQGTITGELAWSDVYNAIRDVEGVRKVDEGIAGLLLNGLRQTVTLNPIEFPQKGTVTIIDGDTGGAI